MTKKKCKCGFPSIPGLRSGMAFCQFHYDEHQWGTEWAEACLNDHIGYLHQNGVRLVNKVIHGHHPTNAEKSTLKEWLEALTRKIAIQSQAYRELD